MSYTIITSDYNGVPGSTSTYDFLSGEEKPLLPDVDLYNSFNFELRSSCINAAAPPTQKVGAGKLDNRYSNSDGYSEKGVRYGSSTRSPSGAYGGIHVARVPTAMRWINTNGPNGDGIAQNEKGDWFSEEVLARADGKGGGVTFVTNPAPSGTKQFTLVTDTVERQDSATYTVPEWNSLSLKGSYNAAVFCYNEFGYTNDYVGGTYEVNSLWELPEKIDNLYKFIPDQRETTTLTFTIEVDWRVYVSYGLYGSFLSSSQKESILSRMGYNSENDTGTDTHTVTHVINNSEDNYDEILRDILDNRQRTLEEQHERYGQTFPQTEIEFAPAQRVVE